MPSTRPPYPAEVPDHTRGAPPFTELLGRLARAAAATTSTWSSAAVITVAPSGEGELLCSASDRYAATMTCLQHALGEGPYPAVMAEGRSVAVPDVAIEVWRWPMLALAARGHRLAAVHAEPMVTPGQNLLGAIIWYAQTPGLLGADASGGLPGHARQATRTLAFAIRLADMGLEASELPAALRARQVISQAVGVLMQRHVCDADAALARLCEQARLNCAEVATTAAVLVDRAARGRY